LSFRLAHISDLHLSPLPKVKLTDLLSKRLTGYINWQRNRSRVLDDGVLDRLVAHMKSNKPEHIAVTGDLVNLALDAEIENARKWLENFGTKENVSLVPGNHDAYVQGALEAVMEAWAPYMSSDDSIQSSFPYTKLRSEVALVGVNTGCATAPFMATGCFDQLQAKVLLDQLKRALEMKKFRVVMIHHPPFPNATKSHKRLIGEELFREIIAETGAELILHGHTHIDSHQQIDGPRGKVPVIGVPSASHGWIEISRKPAARYNLFDIAGQTGNWSCAMQEFGILDAGGEIKKISQRQLF